MHGKIVEPWRGGDVENWGVFRHKEQEKQEIIRACILLWGQLLPSGGVRLAYDATAYADLSSSIRINVRRGV